MRLAAGMAPAGAQESSPGRESRVLKLIKSIKPRRGDRRCSMFGKKLILVDFYDGLSIWAYIAPVHASSIERHSDVAVFIKGDHSARPA